MCFVGIRGGHSPSAPGYAASSRAASWKRSVGGRGEAGHAPGDRVSVAEIFVLEPTPPLALVYLTRKHLRRREADAEWRRSTLHRQSERVLCMISVHDLRASHSTRAAVYSSFRSQSLCSPVVRPRTSGGGHWPEIEQGRMAVIDCLESGRPHRGPDCSLDELLRDPPHRTSSCIVRARQLYAGPPMEGSFSQALRTYGNRT